MSSFGVSLFALSKYGDVALTKDNHVFLCNANNECHKVVLDGVVMVVMFVLDDEYLLTAGNDKSVRIFHRTTFASVSCSLPKKITGCTALPSRSELFVAIKSGDIYSITIAVNTQTRTAELGTPKLRFGHYSIITDVAIDPTNSVICTSDRDEKIRTTHLPDCLEIQSFCLGHTEFVSRICFLPRHPTLLVSGSGDQTIRLWKFNTGELLQTFSFPKQEHHVPKAPASTLSTTKRKLETSTTTDASEATKNEEEEVSEEEEEEGDDDSLVPAISIIESDPESDVIVATVEFSKQLYVFHFDTATQTVSPQVNVLNLHNTITCVRFGGNRMFVACCDGVVTVFDKLSWEVVTDKNQVVLNVNQLAASTVLESTVERLLPLEFRRKYHDPEDWADVQENVTDRIANKKMKVYKKK